MYIVKTKGPRTPLCNTPDNNENKSYKIREQPLSGNMVPNRIETLPHKLNVPFNLDKRTLQ